MQNQIEKMNRMRRNIFLGLLVGTTAVLVLPLIIHILARFSAKLKYYKLKYQTEYVLGIFLFFLLTLILFTLRYLFYKKKLLKNPALRTAVNDERIKLNWLRAFRFAFFVLVGITIFWKWQESGFFPERWLWKLLRFHLPHGPWLVLWGSIIALSGAFLYYSREVKE